MVQIIDSAHSLQSKLERSSLSYLHEKDIVDLGCRYKFLHLPEIHGKWLFNEHILLRLHIKLSSRKVVRVDGANINYIYTEKDRKQ